jgi:hypothetical protein
VICKTCGIAGDLVAEARSRELTAMIRVEDFKVPIKEAVRSVAHLFHGLCKGPGHCDCQHKVDFEGKTIRT